MLYRKRKAKYEAQITKLENEKRELKRDLHAAVIEPMTSERGRRVWGRVRLEHDMEKCIWAGTHSEPAGKSYSGLLSQMKPDEFPTDYE